MSILTRVTAKLFGGSADPSIVGQIGQFGSAKAGTKLNTDDVATIQALPAYSTGWAAAVITNKNFPPIEEVTGVLKTLSYQNCYLLQEGIPIWDAGTEYSATSVVKSFSGNTLTFYKSKVDGNINHAITDDDYWTPALIIGEREVGVPQITLDFNGSLPPNCIDLQGQSVSQTTYNDLYSIYGTTYNTGDETTGYFRLPDFRNRSIWGDTTAGYIAAGLPNIKGSFDRIITGTIGLASHSSGAFSLGSSTKVGADTINSSNTFYKEIIFNAHNSNSIYDDSVTTVQPPAIKVRVFTRYK